MIYSRNSYNYLPAKAGVYKFLDDKNEIIYIGKANDLKARVSSYFINHDLGEKTRAMVSRINKINITIVESELEALLLEAFYIKKFRPKYNIVQKDNKTYIRVRITINDPYPAVLLARREDDPKSIYFGPYPSSRSVKTVLRTIRRVFPFQSVLNHPKKICLYNHLGLCPCLPFYEKEEILKKLYKKNIRGIIKIFEGKSRIIMKELENRRDKASANEDFEEALVFQKKIDALSLITQPFHKPFEYDVNPNLRSDLRAAELSALKDALSIHIENGLEFKAPAKLGRIECYDISNTQGTNPTASMVVLVDGEIDKSQYRKFRMRSLGPNDFAMMQEVISRRLKHKEWNLPDLIIVDGGRGQVSSALEVVRSSGFGIPVIGLAKREETIIAPFENLPFIKDQIAFEEISLPKNSPALNLIMRIRDEAHRFAITYHKKLRSKNAFL